MVRSLESLACDDLVALLTAAPVDGEAPAGTAIDESLAGKISKKFISVHPLDSLGDLVCIVAPLSRSSVGDSRSTTARTVTLQLILMQRAAYGTDRFEQLLSLMWSIDEYLQRKYLPNAKLSWRSSTNDPLYDQQTAHEHGVFRSVLTIVYSRIS